MLIKQFQLYPTWSDVWHNLPILARIFLLLLSAFCIYLICSLTAILLRLRSLSRYLDAKSYVTLQRSFIPLSQRLANLREMTNVVFCLFLLVFFLGMQAAYWTVADGKLPVWALILENMKIYFMFGGVVSTALLALHLAQWFTSARVRSVEFRLDANSPD